MPTKLSTTALTSGLSPEEYRAYLDLINPITEYLANAEDYALQGVDLRRFVTSWRIDEGHDGYLSAAPEDKATAGGLSALHKRALAKIDEKIREQSAVRMVGGMPVDFGEVKIS